MKVFRCELADNERSLFVPPPFFVRVQRLFCSCVLHYFFASFCIHVCFVLSRKFGSVSVFSVTAMKGAGLSVGLVC